MDSMDIPSANLPARLPDASSRQPAQVHVASRELTPAAAPSTIDSRLLGRSLLRNLWKILLAWVVLAAPLTYLIYRFVEPTYQAYSTIQIESNQPELFDHSLMTRDGSNSQPSYLHTQIELMKSNPVLDLAISSTVEPKIADCPMIKDSLDPKGELRRKIDIQILPNTHLIRVAIDAKQPKEASDIVNAVVNAYLEITADAGTTSFKKRKDPIKDLFDSLKAYKDRLKRDIDKTRATLKGLAERGNVEFEKPKLAYKSDENDQSPQPSFNAQSLEQYRITKDHLMQTEFQIIQLEGLYSAKQAEEQQRQQALASADSPVLPNNGEIRERVIHEFRHDPEVASLIDQIKATNEELEHTKGVVRKGADPARIAAHRRLASLTKDYNDLWKTKSEEIQQRLLVPTSASGVPEPDSLVEIKRKLASLKNTKSRLTELINNFDVAQKHSHADTVEATFLRDDLNRFYGMFDQVNRKLESMDFNKDKAGISIENIDEAQIPKIPNNNKRIRYMVILPVGILFALMGLCMLLEVRTERVGDPDLLSSRVQSEVYALPPLPTTRSTRKLSGPMADDQIERFIQRLDHLRFAVCGDHHGAELGRCVLVTSAVGGEGKTTLAAQLAARCGNAGISTLLIDADLRRGALGPLLDVPEAGGLSDVLDGAKLEDVVIAVQGGTFDLLSAGTPVQDTARLFQGRNFALLIAELRQRYALIFIDSPPVLPVPDALILGRWTDGALLAARFEISRAPQVERARRQLDNAGIPVLGTVINGLRSSDAYYGRYSYDRHRASPANPPSTT
jgi:polysaccharide biosynthesis transport protein